jgi:hypothetical protein
MAHIKNWLNRLSGVFSFMAEQPDESADHTEDDYSEYC